MFIARPVLMLLAAFLLVAKALPIDGEYAGSAGSEANDDFVLGTHVTS